MLLALLVFAPYAAMMASAVPMMTSSSVINCSSNAGDLTVTCGSGKYENASKCCSESHFAFCCPTANEIGVNTSCCGGSCCLTDEVCCRGWNVKGMCCPSGSQCLRDGSCSRALTWSRMLVLYGLGALLLALPCFVFWVLRRLRRRRGHGWMEDVNERTGLVAAHGARNGGNCKVGIDQPLLQSFPLITYRESGPLDTRDTTCSICLGEFMEGDLLRLLPCKHVYHEECIDEWLSSNVVCCLCKQDLRSIPSPGTPSSSPRRQQQAAPSPLLAGVRRHGEYNPDPEAVAGSNGLAEASRY